MIDTMTQEQTNASLIGQNTSRSTYESSVDPSVLSYLDYCSSSYYCQTGTYGSYSQTCCLNSKSYQKNQCTYSYNCYSSSTYTYSTTTSGGEIAGSVIGSVFCLFFWIVCCCKMRQRRMYGSGAVTVVTTQNQYGAIQ